MSLINRMLGDLAARQAPGAETLEGVHLAEPLARSSQVSTATVLVAVAIAIAAVTLAVWWQWPTPSPAPAPRRPPPRTAPQAAAASPVPPEVSARAPAASAPASSWQLTLDPHFAPPSPPVLARMTPLGSPAPVTIELPTTPAPTITASRHREPSRQLGLAEALAPAPVPASASAQKTAAPAAPSASPVEDSAARKRQARDWLAKDQPTAALEVLGEPTGTWDRERLSLRAAALQRADRHAEALAAYRALAVAPGGDASNLVGMAISLEALQRSSEARDVYRQALGSTSMPPTLRSYADSRMAALEGKP